MADTSDILLLPVTQSMVDSYLAVRAKPFEHRLFIVQHMLEDTFAFLRLLHERGFFISKVLAIPYSSKAEIVSKIESLGIEVATISAEQPELDVLRHLREALVASRSDHRRLIIHEVGGYSAVALDGRLDPYLDACAWVVEETTQGKWRYEKMAQLGVPVYQIATSHLKFLEGVQVGLAIVDALVRCSMALGMTLTGKMVLVLGYGTVGSNVARCLKNRGACVAVFDVDPIKLVQAKLDGMILGDRRSLLAGADVVVGATGQTSLSGDDFSRLKSNVVLASASSRDIEFEVAYLRSTASAAAEVCPGIERIYLPDCRKIYLLRGGFPVNFPGGGMPAEVMDLIFAEIFLCIVELADSTPVPGIHSIPIELERKVASTWLSLNANVDHIRPES